MAEIPSVILASGSPRRRALLDQLGWDYIVRAPDVDEDVDGAPEEMVALLCERKARAVAQTEPGVILAADTLVALEGRALGKPASACEACGMLRALSGRAHRVITGVCLMDAESGRMVKRVCVTSVWFHELTEEQIRAYVDSGEPMDKAGAYAIQGGAGTFVSRLDGSYENVIGLPIELLPGMLRALEEPVAIKGETL